MKKCEIERLENGKQYLFFLRKIIKFKNVFAINVKVALFLEMPLCNLVLKFEYSVLVIKFFLTWYLK